MPDLEKPKRKKPSGAQFRKQRAQREAAARGEQMMSSQRKLLWSADMSLGPYQADPQWDPKGPPIQLPIYGAPPVTVIRQVQASINQLEQGAFYASAYLCDGMTRDDRVSAKVDERLDRVVGAILDVEPIDESTLAERVAEACEKALPKLMPYYQLSELMRYALMLGVGVAQVIDITLLGGQAAKTFTVWNPRNLRYDQLYRRYFMVTQNRGEVMIDYQNGYDYSDGGISLNNQDEIPTNWIVYEPFGPFGWMHGAKIRSLALPWAIRYWVRTWWARYQEVHGQPIRLGIIPADRSPADEAIFLSQLSNIGHEAVIRLPQGTEDNKFDVKLLEAASTSWEGFQKLLEHCDDSIAIVLLGQSQSTKGQGGLGTQEKAGESTIVHISRKDALVGNVIRDQLLRMWTLEQFGSPDLAPHLRFRVEPPEDESKAAKVDQLIGQALMAFKNAGAPIDIREYLIERGYPLMTPEQEAQMKQAAVEEAQQMMKMTGGFEEDDQIEEEENEGA